MEREKLKSKDLLDNEAVESDGENGNAVNSDSEEEEDVENDNYQIDDFVVHDAEGREGEGGGANEKEKKKRRKSRKPKDHLLDEEDLELINATKRPSGTQFKRLKKKTDDSDVTAPELKNQISAELWDDAEDLDDLEPQEKQQQRVENFDEDGEEGMDNFIEYDDQQRPAAKPRSRVSSSMMREAEDVFGDASFLEDEDELPERESDRARVKIHEHFDPSLLEEKFITEKDEEIKQADVPERLQLLFGNRASPTESEILAESKWMFNTEFATLLPDVPQSTLLPKIQNCLNFLRNSKYEVPFIAHYRKDYYLPELKLQDLWLIQDLDERWFHLTKKKKQFESLATQAGVFNDYSDLLHLVTSDLELQDLFDHLNLHHFEQIEKNSSDQKSKRATKKDRYRLWVKTGLKKFTTMFGISAKEFGENLMNNSFTFEPRNTDKRPEDAAFEYIGSEFTSTESVLNAVRMMIAQEISTDPQVRRSMRDIFKEKAEVTTWPTERGFDEVDDFHPLRGILSLERKPISTFKSTATFLEIVKAEQEGFVKVKLDWPPNYTENELLAEMERIYLSMDQSGLAYAWNEQRRKILRTGLSEFIFPLLIRQAKSTLTEQAKECVAQKAASDLIDKRLMMGPYRPPSETDDRGIRIMAICMSIEGAALGVCLDPDGELVTHIKLNHILQFGDGDSRKKTDIDNLKRFIEDHAPHCIAIGTDHLDAQRLYDACHSTLSSMDATSRVHLAFVDTAVARVYQSSERAQEEFPEFPFLFRQAVSVGRYLRDPLTETAGLCNHSHEVLHLKLHPLQHMVGREFLLKHLHRCFVNIVASVGVDVNQTVLHKHNSGTLQFVAGLGPRKALHLIQSIERKSRLIRRDELGEMLGQFVLENCAGFLRVSDESAHPLDETRIHPNQYLVVKKMALEILGADLKDEEKMYNKLLKNPKLLDGYDLDQFSEEWDKKIGKLKIKHILYDIAREIHNPFMDPRPAYRDPDPKELLSLMTGGAIAALKIGQLLSARVIEVLDKRIKCRLDDTGVPASIMLEDVSDTISGDYRPSLRQILTLQRGDVIPTRLKSILWDKKTVNLVSKTSELQSDVWREMELKALQQQEPCLRVQRGDLLPPEEYEKMMKRKEEMKKKEKEQLTLKRLIQHPNFKNMNGKEAEDYLMTKDVGEAIIRPSSKGYDHLTVTWRLHDKIFVHIQILERDKPSNNKFSVGKSLYIGNQKYEDLDEILVRYVEPVIAKSKELMVWRNFKLEAEEKIESRLRNDKNANPSRIPYYVYLSNKHHGLFVLAYQPGTRAKREYVSVCPDGFMFRKQLFKNMEKLIAWFKVHFQDALPSDAPQAPIIPQNPTILNQFAAPMDFSMFQAQPQFAAWQNQPQPFMDQRGSPKQDHGRQAHHGGPPPRRGGGGRGGRGGFRGGAPRRDGPPPRREEYGGGRRERSPPRWDQPQQSQQHWDDRGSQWDQQPQQSSSWDQQTQQSSHWEERNPQKEEQPENWQSGWQQN